MKRFFSIIPVLFLLFLFGCTGPGTSIDKGVDKDTSYFNPKYHNPIAIFPTFQYLGEKEVNLSESRAVRYFYVWKDQRTNKFIMITILKPKGDAFPRDYKWVNKSDAIFSRGNIAAYNSLHPRPTSIINEFDGPLPDCVIVASEFYFHEYEVMYKALIVPDKMCAEVAEPVVEELNRVANMQ